MLMTGEDSKLQKLQEYVVTQIFTSWSQLSGWLTQLQG
jgi:hypothetical protein